ncbi:MAG TPA: hypothetical protein PLS53_13875 [Thermoanaerobaculaceae bacterium]|nr:hypothetical protein [Thermoanaerobaculaceae bacterium]HPS79242.1 hypothetical protein [Thermoanaerobaculaceae bacterium]
MESVDLLRRLDAIGVALERSGHALALLGLGSVGIDLGRLDAWSDLDFFVVVGDGQKARFADDLGWLETVAPIVFAYRNTPDGHKVLFADGVFCEMAVFERAELAGIPFSRGRIVWKRPWVDDSLAVPARPEPEPPVRTTEWLLGEALTNLLVGLGRFHRGEKLSAMRLVQGHALDRLVELTRLVEEERPGLRDAFNPDRRVELWLPLLAGELPRFAQGYDHTPESALAILDFLEHHFQVNTSIAAAIRSLAASNR